MTVYNGVVYDMNPTSPGYRKPLTANGHPVPPSALNSDGTVNWSKVYNTTGNPNTSVAVGGGQYYATMPQQAQQNVQSTPSEVYNSPGMAQSEQQYLANQAPALAPGVAGAGPSTASGYSAQGQTAPQTFDPGYYSGYNTAASSSAIAGPPGGVTNNSTQYSANPWTQPATAQGSSANTGQGTTTGGTSSSTTPAGQGSSTTPAATSTGGHQVASAAAEKFFAAQSPEEQQRAVASWGGADNKEAWFQAAVKAGSANPDGSLGGVGNEDEAGGHNYSQNVSGASGLQQGQTPTPTQLRQYAKEKGFSEDYNRYDDATLQQWINNNWNPQNMTFNSEHGGGSVEKPIDTAPGETRQGSSAGGGGASGTYTGPQATTNTGAAGTSSAGGTGQYGQPNFVAPQFTAPTYESAMADPGYQFSLQQGADALQRSAAAQGTLRTSGTLKDLINYGQQAAATQYGNVYNRDLSTFNTQYQGAKDEFAPQYGAWQTNTANQQAQWQAQYGGDLAKYLNKQNNIYGLINTPAPVAPTFTG